VILRSTSILGEQKGDTKMICSITHSMKVEWRAEIICSFTMDLANEFGGRCLNLNMCVEWEDMIQWSCYVLSMKLEE
jgi:hypothetical protein